MPNVTMSTGKGIPMCENSSDQALSIDTLRIEIDKLDSELLSIFNRRAQLALQIGRIKKTRSLPVYDPSREKKIFDRMRENNPGPLDNQAIVRLFERVIDESRRLERIMTADSNDSTASHQAGGETTC